MLKFFNCFPKITSVKIIKKHMLIKMAFICHNTRTECFIDDIYYCYNSYS